MSDQAAATLVREGLVAPRVRGFRSGWIRAPRRARSRWPGDVTASSAAVLDGADVPAWVNGAFASRMPVALVHRLAFAQAATMILGVSYLVISIGR